MYTQILGIFLWHQIYKQMHPRFGALSVAPAPGARHTSSAYRGMHLPPLSLSSPHLFLTGTFRCTASTLRLGGAFRRSPSFLPAPFGAQLFFFFFFNFSFFFPFFFLLFFSALLGAPRISSQAPFGAQAPASRKMTSKT